MQDRIDGVLRRLKLKVTPRRRAVLEVLAAEPTFLSPEEIWKKVRDRVAKVGLPTVYRILDELACGGAVARVIHQNRQLYYYFCGNTRHHHHFICLACHRVEDVDLCLADALEREVSERIRGTLFSHILQLQGLCHECRHKGEEK
ncbi:MAG: Fur family transcriptional regulator [Syntrophorhabdales bacterium]